MKTLLMDAGNSSIKWATLEDGELSAQQSHFYKDEMPQQIFEGIVAPYQNTIDGIIIVSVLDDSFRQTVESFCKKKSIHLEFVTSTREKNGLRNAYNEPEKLGADRFVAMLGARYLYPDSAFISVDVGTATTIDAVTANGQHLGGLILPGSSLCRESLLKNTALLEKWSSTNQASQPELFSSETTQAITSASLLGLAGAIEYITTKMKQSAKMSGQQPVRSIICGGGAEMILSYLESDFDYHPNLLMIGLQAIAQHKKDNNAQQ